VQQGHLEVEEHAAKRARIELGAAHAQHGLSVAFPQHGSVEPPMPSMQDPTGMLSIPPASLDGMMPPQPIQPGGLRIPGRQPTLMAQFQQPMHTLQQPMLVQGQMLGVPTSSAMPQGQMLGVLTSSQMIQLAVAQGDGAVVTLPCLEEDCDKFAEPNGASGRCSLHGGGKQCSYEGCVRYAMSKGLCVPHGGGRNCWHDGCGKLAHSQKTGLCLDHGGGKRCTHLGCTKYTVSKGLCIAHGGGKRCTIEGCDKSARGSTGMCISHGGGRRCTHQGCEKHIQTKGLCSEHGGGRPCQYAGGCNKFAENKGLCKAHGGGRRCSEEGCTKHTVSKGLCIAHGGGKRCNEIQNGHTCQKSAVGGTGKCKAHGGGRRCKEDGCNKHAVSRGLCVSHGGGKTRCSCEGCDKPVCQNPGAQFPAGCIDHQVLQVQALPQPLTSHGMMYQALEMQQPPQPPQQLADQQLTVHSVPIPGITHVILEST